MQKMSRFLGLWGSDMVEKAYLVHGQGAERREIQESETYQESVKEPKCDNFYLRVPPVLF
jgi:hypothetical protein